MSALAQRLLSRGGERVAGLDARPVPHRVILRVIPEVIPRRFDPEAAGDLEAVFELRIPGPGADKPACLTLKVTGGRCTVEPGAAANPGATAEIGAADLIRMVSGAIGFPELLASGRMELGGDPFLALRFPALFRLPARPAG